MSDKSKKTFRVWVQQVNQQYVDVVAADEWEAREKGYTKWRREYAHSSVSYVAEIDEKGNEK